MKRLIYVRAAALLVGCTLALPMSAATNQGNGSGDGKSSASYENDKPRGASAGQGTANDSTQARAAKADTMANRRQEAAQRAQNLNFSRRLSGVELRINHAERDGRYSAAEASNRRAEIAKIRSRYNGNGKARTLSAKDRASLEAAIKAQEDTTENN